MHSAAADHERLIGAALAKAMGYFMGWNEVQDLIEDVVLYRFQTILRDSMRRNLPAALSRIR